MKWEAQKQTREEKKKFNEGKEKREAPSMEAAAVTGGARQVAVERR